MKRNLAFLLLLALAGCKHHGIINRSSIKMIKAIRYRDEDDSVTLTYTDGGKINHIVNAIDDNTKEPLKFDSNCTLHIIYPDSTITVLCHGTSIKYKGATYKLNSSMEEILN
jgi:hypothetical protein